MYKKAFECCISNEVEQCTECPLRDFGDTQLDCKTKLLRNIKPNKVYEVRVDWAFDDNGEDVQTEIYATEERARKSFNFEIAQAMQDYDVFDEATGELIDKNYVLEKGDNYWHLYRRDWWKNCHCLIMLNEKEIID